MHLVYNIISITDCTHKTYPKLLPLHDKCQSHSSIITHHQHRRPNIHGHSECSSFCTQHTAKEMDDKR